MEFTFIVKQRYEKLHRRATYEEPCQYTDWEDDVEMHFFAEEVYDMVSVLDTEDTPVPNPSTHRDEFNDWLENHYDEVAKVIYETFEPDVIDYDKQVEDERIDYEYDRYQKRLV